MSQNDSSTKTSRRWWLAKNNKPEGPFIEDDVIAWLKNGTVSPSVLACPAGGETWRSLSAWPALEQVAQEVARANPQPPDLIPISPSLNVIRLLTNPRLPWMANCICIYSIGIIPALTLLSLPWAFSGEAEASSPAFPLEVFWQVVCLFADIAITAILFSSGLKLKRLQALARRWALCALYAATGTELFLLLGGIFVSLVTAAVSPVVAESNDVGNNDLLLALFILSLAIACFVFQIVAIVWLHRHGDQIPVENGP